MHEYSADRRRGGLEELRERVLQEVNQIRTRGGHDPIYELPKGYVSQPYLCVIARALSDLGIACAAPPRGSIDGEEIRFSEAAELFVKNFDAGCYPDLIDEGRTS